MSSHKLLEFYFGPATIIMNHIDPKCKNLDSFQIKILKDRLSGCEKSEIFEKLFNSKSDVSSGQTKHLIDTLHSFSIDSNSSRAVFSFFKDNTKHAEVAVKFSTKRISLAQNIHENVIPNKDDETVTFSYTGSDQSYVVPSNVKTVIVECWGAGGASQGTTGSANYIYYSSGSAGGGGYTKASIDNISNSTINIVVGGGGITGSKGVLAPSTYGGGGSQNGGDPNWGTASGGGRSAVQLSLNAVYTDVVTAGGGGGAGVVQNSSQYQGYCAGGSGGSRMINIPGGGQSFGKGGDAENNTLTSQHGGTGGTQTSGGTNGVAEFGASAFTNATKYTGGGGAIYGAGGGGGWYGGGYGGIVRNASGGSTTSVDASNLVLWLDASDASTVSTSGSTTSGGVSTPINGGVVTAWKDKSSSALTAVPFVSQNDEGDSTTYTTNGMNGLAGIDMNATSMVVPMSTGTFSGGFTLFVVFLSAGDQSYDTLINRTDSKTQSYPGPWEVHNNYIYIGNSSTNAYSNATTNAVFTLSSQIDPSIYCLQGSNNSPVNCWLNNDLYTNNQLEGYYQDTGSNIYIGSRGDEVTSFNGIMSEIMVFNAVLTLSQVQNVQKYLSSKWKIDMGGPGDTSAVGSGSSWLMGGGGGGSSYVDKTLASAISMEQADGYIVAKADELPSAVKGTVGNGAKATNQVAVGSSGQPGYVRLTLKY